MSSVSSPEMTWFGIQGLRFSSDIFAKISKGLLEKMSRSVPGCASLNQCGNLLGGIDLIEPFRAAIRDHPTEIQRAFENSVAQGVAVLLGFMAWAAGGVLGVGLRSSV